MSRPAVSTFEGITRKIALESGFVCPAYKPRCLERRIAVRMRARGVHTYEDYARVLDSDPSEYDGLVAALTINVTRVFRNPETFVAMRERVIPGIWNGVKGRIRAWSAGCASGEEAWSLAVLFAEHAARSGAPGDVERVSILGSDIDIASLRTAQAARYQEYAFAETPAEVRGRWFGLGPGGSPHETLRSMVSFEQRDLLSPAAFPGPHHLILCRNVLIYFDRPAQDELMRRFHQVLEPGGYLVLGKVEALAGDVRGLFDPVDMRERIYRRRD